MAAADFGASLHGGALRYLLGFGAWTVGHVLVIAGFRLHASLIAGAKATDFPADKDVSTHPVKYPMYPRVVRAHLNCLENLPVFAAVVLVNRLSGAPNIDQLAQIYFWSRVAQSLTHWASVSERAVLLRFGFFLSQMACLSLMSWKTYQHLLSK